MGLSSSLLAGEAEKPPLGHSQGQGRSAPRVPVQERAVEAASGKWSELIEVGMLGRETRN